MSTVTQELKVTPRSTVAQRLIVVALVLAFCYWAQGIVMTLLVSVLLAYFLDPVVNWLEAFRMPRALSSLVVLLTALALLAGLAWAVIVRLDQFGADWPKYRAPLRVAANAVEKRLEGIEARVSEIAPPTPKNTTLIQLAPPHPVRNAVFDRLGSLYEVIVGATFVPFLVFFMLAGKREVWHATMQLFPLDKRNSVKLTLEDIHIALRSFVIGNALVALVLAVASWLFFWAIGLDYALMTGFLSGVLNMVPYFGVVLAWVPPLIVALPKYHHLPMFLAIFGVVTAFHLIAQNVLIPALVGKRVRLNALAVTASLLFWGWLWGGVGLILAIPVTATIRVICDHVEGWQPVGRWMGS